MSKVDIDKLDTDNYAVWSVKMKAYLVIKDLWSTISGKGDVKPGADEKALAQLALHVKDFHLATLSKAESAKDAWETLEAVYQAKSTARRLQLKRELNNLRKEPSEALTKYVSRATDLRDQLIAACHTIEDSEVVMSVLAGLPKEFDTVVAVLEITDDKLELDVVLAKLLQAEQRLTRGEKADNRALFTNTSSRQRYGTGSAGTAGKIGTSGRDKECWHCGKRGHLKADCRQRKCDEQRGHSNSRGGRDGPGPGSGRSDHQSVAAMGASAINWHSDWVLDSGASNHITGNLDLLIDVREPGRNISVTFANGTVSEAKYVGDAVLEVSDTSVILLKDVLYVPSAAANLYSIATATRLLCACRLRRKGLATRQSQAFPASVGGSSPHVSPRRHHATGRVLRRWRAGVRGRDRSSDRYDAGAPACLRRQACSCPSHSNVLSHAWCQACVELCLLGREGPILG